MLVATGVGVLALTGATTFSAYQLGIPPFQTTEPGILRVERAVPDDHTLTSGRSISCDAVVEARDPSDTQLRQLRAMVTSTDWDGYGQRVYRSLSPARTSGLEPDRRAAGRTRRHTGPTDTDYATTSRIRSALAGLDVLDREIIRLVHWDGFTQLDVASLLSLPAGTVRRRHTRARASLRRHLGGGEVSAGRRGAPGRPAG